jgi:hypothetical protein
MTRYDWISIAGYASIIVAAALAIVVLFAT